MLRLPRFVSLAVACAAALPLIPVAPAIAQDAPAAAAPAVNPLRADVENFWHYGKIGKYDLATDAGNRLMGAPDPVALLTTFEAVAADSKDKIDVWMLRWQRVEKMKEVTGKLLTVLDEARRTRRADAAWIDANIVALAAGQRSYNLAIERIRESGELAVPQMIEYLRNPAKASMHGPIRNALRDLGQLALNPLVAATDIKDGPVAISIMNTLAEIGYPSIVPYLAKVAQAGEGGATVQSAARSALARMGAGQAANAPAADQFYDLAEAFYYDKAAVRADTRNPEANVWTWTEDKGLMRVKVPHTIFNYVMAMRSAKTAIKMNTSRDAISFWLLSNYQREVKLADGKDATQPEGTPSAHFYGVAAGTQYLNAALSRSLADADAPVSLKAVKSLQEIVGRTNLLAGPKGEAISDALRFNDRQVRFEAAFAVAAALPNQPFASQERVVPLLAEAVHQTGVPGVLLLVPSDKVTTRVDELKGVGYNAVGAGSSGEVLTAAGNLPSIDVIIVSDEVPANEIESFLGMASRSPRLDRAAKIVMSKTMTVSTDPTLIYTPAADAAALKPVIEAARAKTGGVPMDDKIATGYALRSADLLSKLVINNNKVLDVTEAQPALLAALEDARPEVVKAVGNVLSLMNDKQVQNALANKASDEKAPDEVKVSLFKSLATHAKNHGNVLDADQIAMVQKAVASATSLDVRSAAAEARGALNLPVDQAKTLIIGQ